MQVVVISARIVVRRSPAIVGLSGAEPQKAEWIVTGSAVPGGGKIV